MQLFIRPPRRDGGRETSVGLAGMTIPSALRTVVQFIPQPPLTRSMRVYPLGWLMGDVSRIKTASSASSLR